VRALPAAFSPPQWAISTAEAARVAEIAPEEVLRFDGNTSPRPPGMARPETVAPALATVNAYAHGGLTDLTAAIARYADVAPGQIVLGAGADDLLLLCGRAFASPGDRVAVVERPTYPLLPLAAWLAGAEIGDDDPVVTFSCRPNNPTGTLGPIPDARPLVVDEAYFEYAGDTAAHCLDDGVVVIRTFSKAFGLAAARVGYALADADTAAELRARQAPVQVSTLSAALAVAALAQPPDVRPVLEERERLAERLRGIGLDPPPSSGNFLYVPLADPGTVYDGLLARGLIVRPLPEAVRVTVRLPEEDDRLVEGLEEVLEA
jgi:histidinol-phosphate aminotransferase